MTDDTLSPAQFGDALQKGLGRALLAVRRRRALVDEAAVLDACTHNLAYDAQSEGSRAAWMMEFLDAAEAAERLRPAILAALDQAVLTWDLDQLCGLALTYAQRGSDEARAALHRIFLQKPDRQAPWLADEQIIHLDGIDGFRRVAAYHGARFRAGDRSWDSEETVGQADAMFGSEAVDNAIRDAAKGNADLEAFRLGLSAYREGRPTADRPNIPSTAERMRAISAPQVIEEIGTTDPEHGRSWFRNWGRYASDDELQHVAEAMFSEAHPGRLVKYLACFGRRALPRFDERLLPLAEHPEPDVEERALAALALYTQESLRDLAVTRLRRGDASKEVLGLLTSNYRAGDHVLIEAALHASDDVDERHGFIMALLDLFEKNKSADCVKTMLFAYEHTPCSHCRARAVELLLENCALPDTLREECSCDANDDIREMIRRAG